MWDIIVVSDYNGTNRIKLSLKVENGYLMSVIVPFSVLGSPPSDW